MEGKEPECECECGCGGCHATVNRSCTKTWFRSVKRKLDELETETRSFLIPGLSIPEVARVEIENECDVLREMVTSQQESIHGLAVELEKERSASCSAVNEAMSMILRLQREKAEIEMEARQFKRFSEQKLVHDQQEIAALEELLYKREQTIQSLTCEVQAYKYRMMSYGFTESEAEGVKGVITHSYNSFATNSDTQSIQFDDYPPLKCQTNEQQAPPESEPETEPEIIDIEKYAFSETHTPCSIKDIEHRINLLERSSPRHQPVNLLERSSPRHQPVNLLERSSPRHQPVNLLERSSPRHQPVLDKVIVGHSPRKQKPSARFSMDSGASLEYNFKKDENVSEFESEISDRIYTVDSIHYGAPAAHHNEYGHYGAPAAHHNDQKGNMNAYDDYTGKDSVCHDEIQDPEVMKLYARLQVLEADRESMRQAIINMRTDKAQLVLLKEIAQNLCKDMLPTSRMPVKKRSCFWNFGRSVVSFVLWRRNATQTKYMFGMTASNPGLMVVLDKGSQLEQWRCVSRTQLGAMDVCLKNTGFTKVMVKL